VIRVLIADDQPLMRAGFKTVLDATGSIAVIAEAATGRRPCGSRRPTNPTSC
jgi:DNA-binding NarL/FixJ family response regulator